ncbi:MAG: YbaN family protein [Bacteroidaceae bacterium]|nr:YbaN family protein [Bacteroidaceae bacterium]
MSWFWNTIGIISFALGFLGMFLPILPTTPLWLLAAFSFMKGSRRLYNWAMSIRSFNEIVTNFNINRSIPLRIKVIAVSTLWATIIVSCVIVKTLWIVLLLLTVAIGVTWHILSFKTAR